MYLLSDIVEFARTPGARDKGQRQRRALAIGASIAGTGLLAAGGIGAAKLLKRNKNVPFVPKRQAVAYRGGGAGRIEKNVGRQGVIQRGQQQGVSDLNNSNLKYDNNVRREKGLMALPSSSDRKRAANTAKVKSRLAQLNAVATEKGGDNLQSFLKNNRGMRKAVRADKRSGLFPDDYRKGVRLNNRAVKQSVQQYAKTARSRNANYRSSFYTAFY